jgi:hypothetical protein
MLLTPGYKRLAEGGYEAFGSWLFDGEGFLTFGFWLLVFGMKGSFWKGEFLEGDC